MNHDVDAQMQQRVKANGPSAAFGAACLLAYGFLVSGTPTVTNLFSAGDAVFVWTLRVGGVLLMLAALWCWTGALHALLADAILSTLIGIGLIGSALMMMAGGGMGFNQMLYIIFGVMFTSAGLRNGRDFMTFARFRSSEADTGFAPPFAANVPTIAPPAATTQSHPHAPTTPGPGSLAGELRRRRTTTEQEGAAAEHERTTEERGFTDGELRPTTTDPDPDDPYAQAPSPQQSPRDLHNDHTIPGEEPLIEDYATDDDAHEDTPPPDAPVDNASQEDDQPDDRPPDGFLSSFADEDTPRGV